MNVLCAICSDLFTPSDDIFHTTCGHIFHFVCLTQWLNRSKSCPQCREKNRAHEIRRLYFNFANNDTGDIPLQEKINELTFQLLSKEKHDKLHRKNTEILEKQNAELREQVYRLEAELNKEKTITYALKDQIKYYKQRNAEMEKKEQELDQLRKEIEHYKDIKTLLEASTEEVDEVITRTTETTALTTYIYVMKREMLVCMEKRKELRCMLRSLQRDLNKVTAERDLLSDEQIRRRKLEQDLTVCESDKISLQNKVKELEEHISLLKDTKDFDKKQINTSNNDCNLSHISKQNKFNVVVNKMMKNNEKENTDTGFKSRPILTKIQSNSPYLPIKSRGVFILKDSAQKRSADSLNLSILSKKPRIEKDKERLNANVITYDGFGGHSKTEQFPKPSNIKR